MKSNSAEKRERSKRAPTRYRFMSDDDGHDYIIPADEEAHFRRWLACGPYWDNYKGKEYNDCRIDIPTFFTFIDPREDK